ncbi:MAG: ATP-dependent DNA helicase RecG, partial [Firmicutes bacterium]|nr:ATP-dependent DNA helicase RecG [Bacillota bacterium]
MNGPSLRADIQYVKGVGPSRARCFRRLGVVTVGDLLAHYPKRHEDRRALKDIASLQDGAVETFKGMVRGVREGRPRRGLVITTVLVSDGSGVARVVWFNQPYMAGKFPPGRWFIFTGKVARRAGGVQVTSVEYEEFDARDPINTGRLVPVYSLTEGLTQRTVRAILRTAVDAYSRYLEDPLPGDVRASRGLVTLEEAVRNIHFPPDERALESARRRLVFDEFFVLQVALAAVRRSASEMKGVAHGPDGPLSRQFERSLPFRLTAAQRRVLSEIRADMERPSPMNRLLMGDVGSGKTVVAALCLLKAAENGHQGALMAPTEILAEQHYANMNRMLGPVGVRVVLLSGSQNAGRRQAVLDEIASGEAQVTVGTHALIQGDVEFKSLSLAITDEQHRFGVRQRALLRGKGPSPDVLVMTATPIPRSLAMTLYADLDLSVIAKGPPG